MNDPRARVLDLVQRHGWNATAFQTLEDGYSYFFHDPDACVAYVDTGGAWVAAGAPLAAGDKLGAVGESFFRAASARGRRACFVAIEERFRRALGATWRTLQVGEQPEWDPREWPASLDGHSSLREQLRRARAKGVAVRLVSTQQLERGTTRDGMLQAADGWLSTRKLAPMGFLLRLDPFSFGEHRRCFVAENGGRIVAYAGLVPVPTRNGYLLEDLVRHPAAPNGTSELLIDAAMRFAAEAGHGFLTLGLTPLSGSVAQPLRLARSGTRRFYDFAGVHRYRKKLRPREWRPIHLGFPQRQSALVSVMDALAAFTDGGFLGFGLSSLRHALRRGADVRRPLAL
ncbi:MAG TPA: DUF2156 domain-containing protein [Polyangiaceae bacterium]